LTVECCSC